MPVTISTSAYEFSHGRRPRGYGSWAFADRPDVDPLDEAIVWVVGTYRDASREARRVARERGVDVLVVLP